MPILEILVGGIAEFLSARGWVLLMETGIAGSLMDDILTSREDEESSLERAGRLTSYIQEHFDLDRNAEKFKALYEKVIDKTETAKMEVR